MYVHIHVLVQIYIIVLPVLWRQMYMYADLATYIFFTHFFCEPLSYLFFHQFRYKEADCVKPVELNKPKANPSSNFMKNWLTGAKKT